jgi:ribosomal protein L37AE/L43A
MRASLASTPDHLVCPVCHLGELRSFGDRHARCGRCGNNLSTGMLTTMEQIVALPDALGGHSCDCGHPEMRLLPDGIYHCPSCGSEVRAIETPPGPPTASLC